MLGHGTTGQYAIGQAGEYTRTDIAMSFALVEDPNSDIAVFGLNVYDNPTPTPTSGTGASVTIIEVPAENEAGMSIREP